MNEITVNVPLETVNAALQALSKMPYEFSAPHIAVLQQRGNAAVEAANAANAAKAAKAEPAKAEPAKGEAPKPEGSAA